MSQVEEDLDAKIARIRKQNAQIIERQKMIAEEIESAARNNAIVKLKPEGSGSTLHSDKLSNDRKVIKSSDNSSWDEKHGRPTTKKSTYNNNKDVEWREERKRIDEERIRRQKANSGTWRREWDADKMTSNNEYDDRSSGNSGNRFDRGDLRNERSENRKFNSFNEARGSCSHTTNEEDTFQNYRKIDSSNRKSYSEHRTSDYHNDRKPGKTDDWKPYASEADKYNNNAINPHFKSDNFKIRVQNASGIKKEQFLEENLEIDSTNKTQISKSKITEREVKDVMKPSANHEVLLTSNPQTRKKTTSRLNSRLFTHNQLSFNAKSRLSQACESKSKNFAIKNADVENSESNSAIPKDLKNFVVHLGNSGSDRRKVLQPNQSSFNVKSTLYQSSQNKTRNYVDDKSKEEQLETDATTPKNLENIAVRANNFGLKGREVHLLNQSSFNVKSRLSRPFQSKTENIMNNKSDEEHQETIATIPKDLKNIVVRVKDSNSDKREVKVLSDVKNYSQNLNSFENQNVSQEFDSNSSPSYSLTFERSDLKQKMMPTYHDEVSSQVPIVTQMFSNSKISDINCFSNDVNFKLNNFNQSNSDNEQLFTNVRSPEVFQFTATENKSNFGDIVHNMNSSQNVEVIRTINADNIVQKSSPTKTSDDNTKTKVRRNLRIYKEKGNRRRNVKFNETVQQIPIEDNLSEDDEEWEDVSDDEWEDVTDDEE